MSEVLEFKTTKHNVLVSFFLSITFFCAFVSFGFQALISAVLTVFICSCFLIYFFKIRSAIFLDHEHLYLGSPLEGRGVNFKDFVSMSSRRGYYCVRLKSGEFISVPPVDDFFGFERIVEQRAGLVLIGESLFTRIRFISIFPKDRRWAKKSLPYKITSVLDIIDPGYIQPRILLPLFVFGGFVFGMIILYSFYSFGD